MLIDSHICGLNNVSLLSTCGQDLSCLSNGLAGNITMPHFKLGSYTKSKHPYIKLAKNKLNIISDEIVIIKS